MNTNNDDEEHFAILRKIANKPEVSQRVMAHELGFSLGKLNYCLTALKSKGLVKIKRFKETRNYVQRVIENINVYKYTLNKDPVKIDGFFRK
jgi:transcription initiation factor IIE alpha subunit